MLVALLQLVPHPGLLVERRLLEAHLMAGGVDVPGDNIDFDLMFVLSLFTIFLM
jgi:hypothetical protein